MSMAPARIHIELATTNRLGAQLKENRGKVPEVANGVRIIRSGTRPPQVRVLPLPPTERPRMDIVSAGRTQLFVGGDGTVRQVRSLLGSSIGPRRAA
jgi:hypothetical protein